jgi:hypothetical protein
MRGTTASEIPEPTGCTYGADFNWWLLNMHKKLTA